MNGIEIYSKHKVRESESAKRNWSIDAKVSMISMTRVDAHKGHTKTVFS